MLLGKCAGSIGGETVAVERDERRSAKTAKSDQNRKPTQSPSGAPATAQRVTSSSLFRGGRLLLIEHAGSEYRLQITSRGKLILTR